ncbi:hypothetical protein 010DV004_171 [Bacillus phage 010DV004]|nr:hypothetical protein 010DV004_171 [Bacillus phage 010DV004]QZA69388.1 hypothetical protein 010DV005_171 [Bacillus phage 010DV005]
MQSKTTMQILHDHMMAIQKIDWICKRARIHGVDIDDIAEIEEMVDLALGRDKEVREGMKERYGHK